MAGLFDPLKLGSLELPNRFVMAPLTRARAGREAVPNELMAAYYAQRAGAGLIISEATGISREGLGWPGGRTANCCVNVPWKEAFIVIGPDPKSLEDLGEVIHTLDALCLGLRVSQGREEKCCQDCNDGDNHQEFDQSKC